MNAHLINLYDEHELFIYQKKILNNQSKAMPVHRQYVLWFACNFQMSAGRKNVATNYSYPHQILDRGEENCSNAAFMLMM